MISPSPHFKAQIGHTRVKLGEVRVVLTVSVAFYSDFLENDETPIICFEPHLSREIEYSKDPLCRKCEEKDDFFNRKGKAVGS